MKQNAIRHAQTSLLRVLDNAYSGTVFHAPTRILELGFGDNIAASLLRPFLQSDLQFVARE
jgi:hypothetical protein